MDEYTIRVTFYIDVEAENKDDAENIGYDWYPKHPQTKFGVHPEIVDVVEGMESDE